MVKRYATSKNRIFALVHDIHKGRKSYYMQLQMVLDAIVLLGMSFRMFPSGMLSPTSSTKPKQLAVWQRRIKWIFGVEPPQLSIAMRRSLLLTAEVSCEGS